MPKRLIGTHRVLGIGLLIYALFLAGHYALSAAEAKYVFDVLGLACGIVVSLVALPAALDAVKRGLHEGEDKYLVSTWMAWTTLWLSRGYAVFFTWVTRGGSDDAMVEYVRNQPWAGSISVWIFLAGLLAVAAPLTASNGQRFRPIFAVTIIAIAIAAVITGVMIGIYLGSNGTASGVASGRQ